MLSALPIDARHIAHQTIAGGRIAGKRLEEITHLPPKPRSIKDATTWHFACQKHDDLFKPIDEGIVFPSCREYMRIQTEEATGATTELEEMLFLMAYRSVLSSLSILRGAHNALNKLRLEKGNHQRIKQQLTEVSKPVRSLMEYRRQYNGRFAGVQGCDMVHHLVTGQPHTRLTMSYVGTNSTINILPDNGISRIVVSHKASESEKSQLEIENRINTLAKELSDRDNKKPFIDLVTTLDAYIAPADYEEWPESDKDALMRTAAQKMRQFL